MRWERIRPRRSAGAGWITGEHTERTGAHRSGGCLEQQRLLPEGKNTHLCVLWTCPPFVYLDGVPVPEWEQKHTRGVEDTHLR